MSSSNNPQQNNESELSQVERDNEFQRVIQEQDPDLARICAYEINEIYRDRFGFNMSIPMYRMYLDLEYESGHHDSFGDEDDDLPPMSLEECEALDELARQHRQTESIMDYRARNRMCDPYTVAELYPDVVNAGLPFDVVNRQNNSNNDHHNSNNDHHNSNNDHHNSNNDHHNSNNDHHNSNNDHHNSNNDHHNSNNDHHNCNNDHHNSNNDHHNSNNDHHNSNNDHHNNIVNK